MPSDLDRLIQDLHKQRKELDAQVTEGKSRSEQRSEQAEPTVPERRDDPATPKDQPR